MTKTDDTETALACDGLRLEPILPAHAARLFDDLQAPELYAFIPHEPPESLPLLEARYARWSARQSPDGGEVWLNYAVFHVSETAYVGTLQATLQSDGKTHIAYDIFPRFWRRGFAKKACRCLLQHLFETYRLETVSALVDTRNGASWKLLESLGFQRVATLKDADHFKGFTSDEFAYELTHVAWQANKSNDRIPTRDVTT